jgi:two-component system chemotaxis response regulator CheV
MNIKQTDILLESGTNELEVMEFTIAGEVFGINVAKVREIMKLSPVKPMQHAHPAIEGVYKPRMELITVVDLAQYLDLPPSVDNERDIFIITHFNNLNFAFHVHSVVGIDRISWGQIEKPDSIIYGVATGIAQFQNRLITILDFEKIVTDISPLTSIQLTDIDKMGPREKSGVPILIAEDSMMLAKMIVESLAKAGYTNVIKTSNGEEAWNYLIEAKEAGDSISNHVACIITDIEMPKMDGHRLTKLSKDDSVLKSIPIIIFSSLINEEMFLKGKEVGADEQITKPEIANLVSLVDRWTIKKKPAETSLKHEK